MRYRQAAPYRRHVVLVHPRGICWLHCVIVSCTTGVELVLVCTLLALFSQWHAQGALLFMTVGAGGNNVGQHKRTDFQADDVAMRYGKWRVDDPEGHPSLICLATVKADHTVSCLLTRIWTYLDGHVQSCCRE